VNNRATLEIRGRTYRRLRLRLEQRLKSLGIAPAASPMMSSRPPIARDEPPPGGTSGAACWGSARPGAGGAAWLLITSVAEPGLVIETRTTISNGSIKIWSPSLSGNGSPACSRLPLTSTPFALSLSSRKNVPPIARTRAWRPETC
jgi:hypothetical protein